MVLLLDTDVYDMWCPDDFDSDCAAVGQGAAVQTARLPSSSESLVAFRSQEYLRSEGAATLYSTVPSDDILVLLLCSALR